MVHTQKRYTMYTVFVAYVVYILSNYYENKQTRQPLIHPLGMDEC